MQQKFIQSQKDMTKKVVAATQATISHVEQVAALNMELVKQSVVDVASLCERSLEAKTPNEAFELLNHGITTARARLIDYVNASCQIAFGLHAQFARGLEEQMAFGESTVRESFHQVSRLVPEASAATESVKNVFDVMVQAGEAVRTNLTEMVSAVENQALKSIVTAQTPVSKSAKRASAAAVAAA